jgi:hypothetical protein
VSIADQQKKGAWSLILNEKPIVLFEGKLPCEVRGHCMCKEMPVILGNRVVDQKKNNWKNGGPWRRRGTGGRWPQKNVKRMRITPCRLSKRNRG